MDKIDGGTAFPAPFKPEYQDDRGVFLSAPQSQGMSLRDYFAAAALQGIMAGDHPITHDSDCMESVPNAAYAMADAMLRAREK